jgi:tRNA(Ile)-lysidine synthase
VLPLLEDVLRGGVAEALARTAAQLQDDLDALDALAAAHTATAALDTADLSALPRAVRTRVLHGWALAAGAAEMAAVHVAALDALVTGWHGQRAVQLPGGVSAKRESGKLIVVRSTDA